MTTTNVKDRNAVHDPKSEQQKGKPMNQSTGHTPENVTRDPETGRFETISEHKSSDKPKHPTPAKSK